MVGLKPNDLIRGQVSATTVVERYDCRRRYPEYFNAFWLIQDFRMSVRIRRSADPEAERATRQRIQLLADFVENVILDVPSKVVNQQGTHNSSSRVGGADNTVDSTLEAGADTAGSAGLLSASATAASSCLSNLSVHGLLLALRRAERRHDLALSTAIEDLILRRFDEAKRKPTPPAPPVDNSWDGVGRVLDEAIAKLSQPSDYFDGNTPDFEYEFKTPPAPADSRRKTEAGGDNVVGGATVGSKVDSGATPPPPQTSPALASVPGIPTAKVGEPTACNSRCIPEANAHVRACPNWPSRRGGGDG